MNGFPRAQRARGAGIEDVGASYCARYLPQIHSVSPETIRRFCTFPAPAVVEPPKVKSGWALSTKAKNAEVLRLWREGKRIRDCGRATDLPDGSVWNILERAGIDPGARAKDLNKRIKVEELLKKGTPVKEIALSLKTSDDYVYQCRRRVADRGGGKGTHASGSTCSGASSLGSPFANSLATGSRSSTRTTRPSWVARSFSRLACSGSGSATL